MGEVLVGPARSEDRQGAPGGGSKRFHTLCCTHTHRPLNLNRFLKLQTRPDDNIDDTRKALFNATIPTHHTPTSIPQKMTTSPFISAALLIATLTACASAPLPGCTVYVVTQAQALLYQGVSLH